MISFDDENGYIAHAICDIQLARNDESKQRFYSIVRSNQQRAQKMLQCAGKVQQQIENSDITVWLE